MLNQPPAMSGADAVTYKRGAPPLTNGHAALPFDQLLTDLERSQISLRGALSQLSPADLAQVMNDQTMGERFAGQPLGELLAFLQFHEAYHCGQIGLLRRIAGKEGKIK
jgi:uncharacterized damage-inducible protein DinB